MIIEHLFFIVGKDQILKRIKEGALDQVILIDEDKIVSDITTQVNTVQTASVPDKLDEFKRQSTTVRNNNEDSEKELFEVYENLIF